MRGGSPPNGLLAHRGDPWDREEAGSAIVSRGDPRDTGRQARSLPAGGVPKERFLGEFMRKGRPF